MTSAVLTAVFVVALGHGVAPHHPPRRTITSNTPTVARPDPGGHRPHRHRLGLRRPRRATAIELAVWCDAIARSLRSGSTLRAALVSIEAPPGLAHEFAPAMLALERGATVAMSLRALDDVPPDLDLVVVVLRACAEHGGGAAEPIDRAASALRQRAALTAERRTQSAQARMSALVMTALPGAMLAVLLATSRSVREATVTAPGMVAITCGALCNVAGWMWMRRLIGSDR